VAQGERGRIPSLPDVQAAVNPGLSGKRIQQLELIFDFSQHQLFLGWCKCRLYAQAAREFIPKPSVGEQLGIAGGGLSQAPRAAFPSPGFQSPKNAYICLKTA
jgi:hypothetical protein